MKILHLLWRYFFRPYLILAGLLATVMVGRQLYLQKTAQPPEVKMQLHLKIPNPTAKVGG